MKLSLQMLDYRKLATVSIAMNLFHATMHFRWPEISLSRLGTRSGSAQMFIAIEGLFYMALFAAGFDRITENYQPPTPPIELGLGRPNAAGFNEDGIASNTSTRVRRSKSETVIWFIAATVSVALLVLVHAIGG